MTDVDSVLSDDYGLVEGAKISVKMGDSGSNTGAAYFSSNFTIVSSQADGDHLTIDAMESGVYAIKQPAGRSKVFLSMLPADILKDLFSGYPIVMGTTISAEKVTYHVPIGSTPSVMLRQMGKDLGCAIWLARGSVYCIPFQELLLRQPKSGPLKIEFQGSVKSDAYAIYAYKPIYASQAAAREQKKQYMTWDTEAGFVISKLNDGCPREFLPVANLDSLDASVWRWTDRMTVDLVGSGMFSAGLA
ncbi:MAG: hypothetical protein ACRCT2_05470, partial [Plesiomonas shigelloides]